MRQAEAQRKLDERLAAETQCKIDEQQAEAQRKLDERLAAERG
jgi:hypothetical protein